MVLLISVAVLASAWSFQIFGGYQPCPLCLQQRWAWYAVAPFCFLLAVLAEAMHRAGGLVRFGLIIAGLCLLAGAALAGYHTGVEWGWWEGPQSCSGGGGLSGGLPDLNNVTLVRCDDVQWTFAGLSFAGWNTVISFITALIAFNGARKP